MKADKVFYTALETAADFTPENYKTKTARAKQLRAALSLIRRHERPQKS
jgi:hypothetical protein